jgi:hypothetical protein
MRLLDLPRALDLSAYEAACSSVLAKLQNNLGVVSVYQIGGFSSPGISDIDLVTVFHEDATDFHDPRSDLKGNSAYLFTHGLFATTVKQFNEARLLTFFHNYRLLHGPELYQPTALTPSDEADLKTQIALEYLLRMFVSLSVEVSYRALKVRNLLLHAKALIYDCEFLRISGGALWEVIHAIVQRRNSWFKLTNPTNGLEDEVRSLHHELEKSLSDLLSSARLYLPQKEEFNLARHLLLVRGEKMTWSRRGFVPPRVLMWALGPRCTRLVNRVNRFTFSAPFVSSDYPPIIRRAFDLRSEMVARVRSRFPHYMPLATSLNVL